ncbi:hypothetical protein GGR58DRAFT_242313 [Xylaria digitata]|nr:hypothetical protein GGR58DRAFT_242313 [Xylaria digitata]
MDCCEWLSEKELSLVRADNPAFEVNPSILEIDDHTRSLPRVFIASWGQSIVEFLYLGELMEALRGCVVSGKASPPNGLAILWNKYANMCRADGWRPISTVQYISNKNNNPL